MKKNLFRFGIIILVMALCSLMIFEMFKEKRKFEVKVNENQEKACKAKLYYEEENRKIYSYCLESIKFKGSELKVLLNDGMRIDDIVKNMKVVDLYKDGGSKLYRNQEISILMCQTIDGNKDIYIGNKKMKYEKDFCQSKSETFIKTYKILNIEDSNDYDYLYITIRQFQGEEVETVKVKRDRFNDVEVGKNYEITFKNKGIEKDTIKDIFTQGKIVSVVLTTKEGLDQVNENI